MKPFEIIQKTPCGEGVMIKTRLEYHYQFYSAYVSFKFLRQEYRLGWDKAEEMFSPYGTKNLHDRTIGYYFCFKNVEEAQKFIADVLEPLEIMFALLSEKTIDKTIYIRYNKS